MTFGWLVTRRQWLGITKPLPMCLLHCAAPLVMYTDWPMVSWLLQMSWRQTLHWRHNGRDGFSNHQSHHCLLNRLFRCRSKKTSKLRVTGLCAGNSPVTGEFPAQMASNAENVFIWWRHHAYAKPSATTMLTRLRLLSFMHNTTQRTYRLVRARKT